MQWTRLCLTPVVSQHDGKTRGILAPQEASPLKQRSVVGIAMAQQVLHLVGMDEHGTMLGRTRLYRAQVMGGIAPLPPTLMGLEACGGAHGWARRLREHDHEGQLRASQCVKPEVKMRAFVRVAPLQPPPRRQATAARVSGQAQGGRGIPTIEMSRHAPRQTFAVVLLPKEAVGHTPRLVMR